MSFPNHPTTSFSWADDEEDDFDLEAWRASADTSAPTANDLGPLHVPSSEDESEEFISIPSTSRPTASSLQEQAEQQAKTKPALTFDSRGLPEFKGSQEKQIETAVYILLERALRDKSAAPAYNEMSWDIATRYKYADSWRSMKVKSGLDCRRPVQFKCSPLQHVMGAQEEEAPSEPESIVGEIDDEEVEWLLLQEDADTLEDLPPRQFVEIDISLVTEADRAALEECRRLCSEDDLDLDPEEASIAAVADAAVDVDFDFAAVLEDGVHTATKGTEVPTVMESGSTQSNQRTERTDSMEALVVVRESLSAADVVEDAVELQQHSANEVEHAVATLREEHHALATGPSGEPSPDLAYIDAHPSFARYFTGAISTGCFLVSSLPWIRFGVCAAAMVVAGVSALQ
ncbi:hypothetical protein ACN47E_009900 [Coniothyrium glycines]